MACTDLELSDKKRSSYVDKDALLITFPTGGIIHNLVSPTFIKGICTNMSAHYSMNFGRIYIKKASKLHTIMNLLSNKSIVLIIQFMFVAVAKCSSDENCVSIPTEIHVTKEEYDEMGRLKRSCSGDVTVTKCEGMCDSQVQPSVVTATGFLKECFCCRENYLRERLVTLTHCYDPDGLRLEEEDQAIMEVRIREPTECKCYKCGDFSR